MKQIGIACFTEKGRKAAERLQADFASQGWDCRLYDGRKDTENPSAESLADWTQQQMQTAQAIIFVGACGIAVRSIAPFLRGKAVDPAVLAVNDTCDFVISLLSGHIGGANALARQVASLLGAVPVITTATDNAGLFAVDEWAEHNQMAICSLKEAKAVSAALLQGRPVGLHSEFALQGDLPPGIEAAHQGEIGIQITTEKSKPKFKTTLFLVPRIVTLGIGCRKGTSADAIEAAVEQALVQAKVLPEALFQVCSVDLKREEPGLLEFCRRKNLPLITYSSEELAAVPGEFSSSDFVRKITGTDNICERSAVLGGGTLFLKKQIGNGVTVAAAMQNYRVLFEKEL